MREGKTETLAKNVYLHAVPAECENDDRHYLKKNTIMVQIPCDDK